MSAKTELLGILEADAGVGALVADRIFANEAEKSAAYPLIVFRQISGPKINQLNGAALGTNARIQISCWSQSLANADAIADAVEAALVGTGFVVNRFDTQDPMAEKHGVILDWKRIRSD